MKKILTVTMILLMISSGLCGCGGLIKKDNEIKRLKDKPESKFLSISAWVKKPKKLKKETQKERDEAIRKLIEAPLPQIEE